MTNVFKLEIPELRRMDICYSEDCREGTVNQLVYVLLDFDPETEKIIVVPFDDWDGVFKAPVRFVFDGHAFPFKVSDAEIIEAIGAGLGKKLRNAWRRLKPLSATIARFTPTSRFHPWVASVAKWNRGRCD